MMLRYKTHHFDRNDKIITKWHKTYGKFGGWTTGGAFGFTYAVIVRQSTILYIPRHDIHSDDMATLEQATQ